MAGWITTTIEDACNVEYGTRVVQKRDGGSIYPVYGGGGATFFMDVANRTNRIVVSRFGMSENCTRHVKGDFFLNDSGLTLSPKDAGSLQPEFLDRITLALNDDIYALGKGAAQKNLDVSTFRGMQIAYPASLTEQRRIVAILDDAFEGIATAKAIAEKNLQNAMDLFSSHLQSINCPKVSLGDLVNITTGKLDANAAVESGAYPFFTCSRDVYSIDKYAFDCEALLLAGNNAVGDFNVKHYKGKFNAYQRTYVITINEQQKALCRFLYFELLKGLARFKSQSVGAGTKFLKIGMIEDLQVSLPEMSEQRRLASLADQVRQELSKLEGQLQKKLAALEELKKSLLHQAFTGQL